jgi:hypothetical protein
LVFPHRSIDTMRLGLASVLFFKTLYLVLEFFIVVVVNQRPFRVSPYNAVTSGGVSRRVALDFFPFFFGWQ